MELILVGTGYMAQEYAKVLLALGVEFTVVGRSERGCVNFKEKTGVDAIPGGIREYLSTVEKTSLPRMAINAASIESLADSAIELLNHGVIDILLEKPGAISNEEFNKLHAISKQKSANVYIAYNRRFYASTLAAQKMIDEDGGVSSFTFDFTEWAHEIEKLGLDEQVLSSWLIANSSHVIDMAFFLGGRPRELSCYAGGNIPWHPPGSKFYGAGVSECGAPFSYQADWSSAGRWAVHIMTVKRKLIFCPLEGLSVMEKGSVAIKQIAIDDALDKKFKPGLYKQVESFLNKQQGQLCTIGEHFNMFLICNRLSCLTASPGNDCLTYRRDGLIVE